jgi:hypothetical protein
MIPAVQFYIIPVVSLFLILIATILTSTLRHGRSIVLGGGLLGILLFIMNPLLALNCFMLAMAAVLHIKIKSSRSFFWWSLGATTFSYMVITLGALLEMFRYASQEKNYPWESMETRLSYENRIREAPLSEIDALNAEPDSSVNRSLDVMEDLLKYENYMDQYNANERVRVLKMIHASRVQQFISSPGFGYNRMLSPPNVNYLHVPDMPPIVLPATAAFSPKTKEKTGKKVINTKTLPVKQANEQTLWHLHLGGIRDFISPLAFVYVRDKQHVAGFIGHRYSKIPWFPDVVEGEKWHIQRLELVSFLRFEEPRVYVSKHLPRMDELQEAGTRPLDDFERSRLDHLRKGKDVTVSSTANEIRMLGGLRAVSQCLRCHDVRRGELLGAFSYSLGREKENSAETGHGPGAGSRPQR